MPQCSFRSGISRKEPEAAPRESEPEPELTQEDEVIAEIHTTLKRLMSFQHQLFHLCIKLGDDEMTARIPGC